jgi:hypothetical protein
MRGTTGLTSAAWVAHALAWFLPVHKYGVRLPHGVPGWQAFRIAVSPIWPYEGSESGPWYGAALTTASGLTNLVLLASVAVLLTGSIRAKRTLAWIALAACVINCQWFVLDTDRADLRIGYYLWWASFAILAAAAFTSSRQAQSRVGTSGPTSGCS